MAAEARVGILLVVFVLLVLATLTYLTGRWEWLVGRPLMVHFQNVEGLVKGSKVLLSGMEIGRVMDIHLGTLQDEAAYPERPIVVKLLIRKGIYLKDTDQFILKQTGMLGDTNIEILRTSEGERKRKADARHQPYQSSRILTLPTDRPGDRAFSLTDLGEEGRGVLDQVKGVIAEFKALYAGPDIRRRLDTILDNTQKATARALQFSESLARLSVQNEARMGATAREVAAAAAALNVTADRVRRLVANSAPNVEGATARVARMVDTTAANVEAATAHMARTGDRVEKLVKSAAGDMESTTARARQTLERTSRDLEAASARLNAMVAKSADNIEKTTGLVESTTRASMADLAATTKRARDLMDRSAGHLEAAAASVDTLTSQMAAVVSRSGKDISDGAARVNAMVQKSAADVEAASGHLAQLSATMHSDLTAITGRAAKLVESSSADVGRTTARLAKLVEASAADIEQTTRRIRDTIAFSPLPQDLAAAGEHIRKATENIELVSRQVADPALTAKLRSMVANLETASSHLVAMSEEGTLLVKDTRVTLTRAGALATDDQIWNDIRATVKQMRRAMDELEAVTAQGKRVLTDPKLAQDLTASVANVRELTAQGVEVARKADRTLARVDQTMDKVSEVTHKAIPTSSRTYGTLVGARRAGLRADVTSDLYFGGSQRDYWRIGLRDVGDTDTLILEKGLQFGKGETLRLGILGSRPAAGLDYPLGGHLSLQLDLWDPNKLHFDAAGVITLGRDWDLLFGANDIFSRNDAFIGIRRSLFAGQK